MADGGGCQAYELTHQNPTANRSCLPQCLAALEVMMRLKMKARQEVAQATAGQYRSASKKRRARSWTIKKAGFLTIEMVQQS